MTQLEFRLQDYCWEVVLKTHEERLKIWQDAVKESRAHCAFCAEYEDGETLWYMIGAHDGDIEGLPPLCKSWAAAEVEG